MSATHLWAQEADTNRICHIDNALKGAGTVYLCRGCGREMIAVKSAKRKRDWHFRHKVETFCNGGYDKALHDYVQQILMSSTEVRIDRDLRISYANQRKNLRIGDYFSDVAISHGNSDIHFEIVVTHDLGVEKTAMYRSQKVKCIRIDFSDPSWHYASADEIKAEVLDGYRSKEIIFWEEQPTSNDVEQMDWAARLLTAVLLLLLIYFIGSGFRKRKLAN